jgi:hypothetical protein
MLAAPTTSWDIIEFAEIKNLVMLISPGNSHGMNTFHLIQGWTNSLKF